MGDELFGLKKQKRAESNEGIAFTFEERAELFDDLLEDDNSSFPLLEAPHEVLAVVGSFLDAVHLAALSELCLAAHQGLDEAFREAWTELLLRDFMPRSRAKRYRASASAYNGRAGVVLTALDLSRVEWDGLMVAAPSNLRYRFLHSMHTLKARWGRMAQSWEWFATRVLRRMTHDQLEILAPTVYQRPDAGGKVEEYFDEITHRASMDRNLRQRQPECSHKDVIATMKRRLGVEDATAAEAGTANEESAAAVAATAAAAAHDDVLSAMAPTARDQRLQANALERSAAAAASAAADTTQAVELPQPDVVERMSFSEQLELALRVSQAEEEVLPAATQGPATATTAAGAGAPAGAGAGMPKLATEPRDAAKEGESATATTAAASAAGGEGDGVLLRFKARRAAEGDVIEVVLRQFTTGDEVSVPAQLHRSLEQTSLRLTREDWLLFYEGIAVEAQLRARTVAQLCREMWHSVSRRPCVARRLVDLEAEMLQLPIFNQRAMASQEAIEASASRSEAAGVEEEGLVRNFLAAWEAHEAWASSLEEHLGPLDMEISRERTNNMQRGKAHTPYSIDLCRLAFRNFAVCEGRLFFVLALTIYGIIERLCSGHQSEESIGLLEQLHRIAGIYAVEDDFLAVQRNTLQEFKYYLLEPLRRACRCFSEDAGDAEDEEETGPGSCGRAPSAAAGAAARARAVRFG
eukprot:TRINITY_DN46655_c0_g1_i1.p1 TRINITY_DN46655_c0_g1~~TRINITY_DN46655_c0_g1_i1.p1  ORF type:complete len:695 (-),score=184.88 TRINITY_DN46655_c0_g1_i1:19-2103(-)